MYIHLAVAEAVGDAQVREVVRIVREHVSALPETDFVALHIDVEDGGSMVLITTVWRSRQALLNYASGRAYRKLTTATQHLLIGNVVVKVFRRESGEGSSEVQR